MRTLQCLLLISSLFTLGCGADTVQTKSPWGGTTKLKALTSIVPVYCLTAQVAGDDAEVLCLMTAHGPHDFTPTSEDVKMLSEADLFFVIGLKLEESYTEGMIKSSDNRRLKQIRLGNSLPNERLLHTEGVTHYHGDKLVTHPGGADPHVWLGLDEASLMVDTIAQTLIDRDAAHAVGYKQRAAATKAKLALIKQDHQALATGKHGGIITFHDSFRYFARTFNLEIAGTIRDVRGDQPLSPAALREQAEEFRKKNVKVIGVEPQYPRGVAENLAKEMGGQVKIIDLDPIETGPALAGQPYKVDKNYYFDRMVTNIQNLRQAFP
jgi:zinc transport system substrate-binding protein